MWSLFGKKILGIDVGNASIKIVEISSFGKTKKIENYGEIKTAYLSKGTGPNNKLDVNTIAEAIRAVTSEARMKAKKVIFSIPDFSTFCTSFDIPSMTEKEIAGAIQYNASQYITLPISEVTLDWQVTPNLSAEKKNSSKVFLVAVPNQVVEDYKTIAKLAGLDIHALEAEVFGITRSLIKDNKKVICLVDIGAESTTVNIMDQNSLERSYSFNFSSKKLTDALATKIKLDTATVEQVKQKEGLLSPKKELADALALLIDPLVAEIKNTSLDFTKKTQRQIEEYYFTGGMANMPGLKEYFTKNLNKPTSVPNCFLGMTYPKKLHATLQEMSPSFSAATGVALGGLETV